MMLLVLLCGTVSGSSSAADLFLRLDEVGYDEVADGGKEPVAKVISSIQLTIRPGEPFSGRAEFKGRKIIIRGVCNRSEKPEIFKLQIRSEIHEGSRTVVTNSRGERRAIVNKMIGDTTIGVKVGERITIGGMRNIGTETLNGVTVNRKSEKLLIVVLSESEPNDEDAERDDQ
jgi:hypothetical protein